MLLTNTKPSKCLFTSRKAIGFLKRDTTDEPTADPNSKMKDALFHYYYSQKILYTRIPKLRRSSFTGARTSTEALFKYVNVRPNRYASCSRLNQEKIKQGVRGRRSRLRAGCEPISQFLGLSGWRSSPPQETEETLTLLWRWCHQHRDLVLMRYVNLKQRNTFMRGRLISFQV